MSNLYKFKNRLLDLGGGLYKFPVDMIRTICNAFDQGWDRNRAIDIIGTHNNALMGGYLLAASNTTITITGILTTDLILPLTVGGLVGTVAVNNTISFTTGSNYGAFEVYRAGALIGRYCLTERTGLRLINQYTGIGALPNGLLGGTTTTVWQRSNAFYCETNQRGYSISGTGWVTNAGEAIAVGAIVPADLVNTTKCLAWVGGVQQDLQYVGRAKNSVSVVPYTFYCNADRYWNIINNYSGTFSSHRIEFCGTLEATTVGLIYCTSLDSTQTSSRSLYQASANNTVTLYYYQINIGISISPLLGRPITIVGGFDNGYLYITATDLLTGYQIHNSTTVAQTTIAITAFWSRAGNNIKGHYSYIKEYADGVLKAHIVPDQHSTSMICLSQKLSKTITGVTTNIYANVDLINNNYNAAGYELWINGADYRIYPLASNGTRIITPAGYTLVETVTAGNMPSVADSRFTTFKYALANSCVLRNSVPEAYNSDAQATPKLLTYAELRALDDNVKVVQTEINGKITNMTIRQ